MHVNKRLYRSWESVVIYAKELIALCGLKCQKSSINQLIHDAGSLLSFISESTLSNNSMLASYMEWFLEIRISLHIKVYSLRNRHIVYYMPLCQIVLKLVAADMQSYNCPWLICRLLCNGITFAILVVLGICLQYLNWNEAVLFKVCLETFVGVSHTVWSYDYDEIVNIFQNCNSFIRFQSFIPTILIFRNDFVNHAPRSPDINMIC